MADAKPYWLLRLPWERQPPWWRLWRRRRFRNLHLRIAMAEDDLGIVKRGWDVLPWFNYGWY